MFIFLVHRSSAYPCPWSQGRKCIQSGNLDDEECEKLKCPTFRSHSLAVALWYAKIWNMGTVVRSFGFKPWCNKGVGM